MSEATTSLSLVKGQKVDLTKGLALTLLAVGLGWDVNASANGSKFDVDAFAIATVNGKLPSENGQPNASYILYFGSNKVNGKLSVLNNSLRHSGDNLTGAGDGDDETIELDLKEVPSEVDAVYICLNIYEADVRKQTLGMIQNAFCRAYNREDGSEIVRYDVSEKFSSETAAIVGKVYRYDGEWKFQAIGEGVNGSIVDIARRYL